MIDVENYCVCKQRYMDSDAEALIKEMKEYRDGMVARNLPFQWISDIITKWEMKKVEPIIYDEHNRDTSKDPFKGTSIEGKD